MSNYQKVYMNQIHSSTLLCQLSQMLKTQTLCDAIIRTGNFITKAHRVVLVAACPMLQSMENAAAGSHLEVRLASDIKQDAVNTFLQYLYEGFMMLTEENCRDVEKVARLLQVDSVIKCCSDFYKCVQNKTGAAMPSQYKYSFQDMVEFKHVRTTDLQKMTQERLMKRTSEFSRPGSPGNKRQRIQRGESPDVSGDHADDTASMSHSYMSSTPDPWDRVPRLGSGMFSKTKSSQPGIIDIVEESLEMFQHEPLNKDGHNTDMQVPQKSAAVSISVASHKNTEPDVSIVNISSNKDTGQSSQNVSSNQRGSITVSPLTVQETSGPSSSSSFSAKRQQNISSRQESRLQQQDYHSPQGPPQDSQYSNFSQVGEESMFSTSKHNQVRMSGSEMYITSTPSKQQPVPVSLTAAASVSKPFAMGSANQALAAPPVSLESQAGRNISSSSRTPAGGAGSSNQDYGGDTGPSSLKTEDSNSGDVDLSIVKVEAAQPTISQSHPSASGSSGVGPLGDETGGLDMHVDSEEGGITLTQVRAGLQDEGEELSDTELEDWAKEEMSNEGSNVSGDQNWLQQVYKGYLPFRAPFPDENVSTAVDKRKNSEDTTTSGSKKITLNLENFQSIPTHIRSERSQSHMIDESSDGCSGHNTTGSGLIVSTGQESFDVDKIIDTSAYSEKITTIAKSPRPRVYRISTGNSEGLRKFSMASDPFSKASTAPCICRICQTSDMVFSHQDQLTAHMLSAHGDTFPLFCFTCGKGFKSQRGLTHHQLGVHADSSSVGNFFKCQFCGKNFAIITDLQRHMKRHSEIRPFVCEYCGKSYKHKKDYKSHMIHLHSVETDPATSCSQ